MNELNRFVDMITGLDTSRIKKLVEWYVTESNWDINIVTFMLMCAQAADNPSIMDTIKAELNERVKRNEL